MLSNANVKVGSTLEVGSPSPITYPGLAAVFTGNIDGYYQLALQNTNSGSNSSGDLVITADDGSDTNYYVSVGINSSNWSGNFTVPAGDTSLQEFPHDGYFEVIGGNATIKTDGNVYFAANTKLVGLNKDGNFALFNTSLQFSDGSVQSTGNVGALNYYPNTAANYRDTITNIQQALDELAARLTTLGG